MDEIQKRLKKEKELFFLRYVLKRPFYLIGKEVLSYIVNPPYWLFLESLFLVFVLFPNAFIDFFNHYGITINSYFWITISVMFCTFVIKVYSDQGFQKDYKKEKEEYIKNALND